MTMPLPREWASNATFSGGAHAGEATKIDPGATIAGNGFYPDLGFGDEHINHQLNAESLAARRAFLLAACRLRRAATEGFAITDTAESMAAAQFDASTQLVTVKTAQALALSTVDGILQQGVPTQITSLVTDVAVVRSNGASKDGQIVAVGTGGRLHSFSDDDGVTWTQGSNSMGISGAGCRIICKGGSGQVLIVGRPGSGNISIVSGLGIASGWISSASGLTGIAGLAPILVAGAHRFMLLDTVTPPAFAHDVSGSLSPAAGTVPNAATFDDAGSIDSIQGTGTVYHCGRRASGSLLQVSSTVDGDAWTLLSTIAAPAGLSFASRPRLMQCENSGLLIIVAPLSSTADALYASLDGVDWAGPAMSYPGLGIDAYALAGGRLMCTRDDMLFASDGVGF